VTLNSRLLLLGAFVLSACDGDAAQRGAADEPVQRNGAAAADAVCLQGDRFTAEGAIDVPSLSAATDAAAVRALRWEPHDGCERLVIDLGTAGDAAAAEPGVVRAEVLREFGIVRVTLPGIERAQADATDAAFDGELAAAVYTVRAQDGANVFVDVHLAGAAEAQVSVLREPARVVLDLRPGGAALGARPLREQRVVVLRPQSGDSSFPLQITGYARTFEANVVARLERDGTGVVEQFTTAASWLEAWGQFTIVIEDGPAGAVTLHVGEYSAKDGTWEGARIPLRMR
jgi:hypothetical protein